MTPLRVAVVGAGPAGFYTAAALLAPGTRPVEVEMFDRLPTPFGLVRTGVAPDHPKIKSVTRVFERTAAAPGFRFHGNVEIGRHLRHHDLLAHHHAVVYTVGSPTDRRLGIPGEDLPGSLSATDFVAWYNGHPEHCDLRVDLDTERAVVVGNGNVAIDVARMLLLTEAELRATDVADHALEALAASRVEEVVLLGRRGPAQAAYTTPELRELGELADADVAVDPADAELDPLSLAAVEASTDTAVRRNVAVVAEYARREPRPGRRRLRLRFLVSPVAILGRERVEAIRVVRNELVAGAAGQLLAHPTDRTETITTGLVLRSIGYRGQALPGLPFDAHAAVLPNRGGRVVDPDTAAPLPGVYTAGWIKRGPTGIIGTNKKDAQETVDALLEDAATGRLDREVGGGASLAALLTDRQPHAVTFAGWQLIDRHEIDLGARSGRPRVKITDLEELVRRSRL